MKMRYSILPARAVWDRRIPLGPLRTLAAMCCFTSVNGICYPGQFLLAELRGVSQPTISKQIKVLRRYGYVVDLVPVGKKKPNAFQRGYRYFIPTLEGDTPPPLELIKADVLAENRAPPET